MSVPYGVMRETYEVEDLKPCTIRFSGLRAHGFGPAGLFYGIFGIALKLNDRLFFISCIIVHDGKLGYTLVSAGSLLFMFGVVLALIGFVEATARLPPGSRQWSV